MEGLRAARRALSMCIIAVCFVVTVGYTVSLTAEIRHGTLILNFGRRFLLRSLEEKGLKRLIQINYLINYVQPCYGNTFPD